MSGDGENQQPDDASAPDVGPSQGLPAPDPALFVPPSVVESSDETASLAPPVVPVERDDSLAAAVAHEPTKLRRSWLQRGVLAFNVLVILACFGAAIGVWYSSEKANDSKLVTLESTTGDVSAAPSTTVPEQTGGDKKPQQTIPPLEDLTAKNFLITGTDNGACVDPDSPYAGAFYDRPFTTNTDTIMVIRVDPATSQAAILSFPRDLWVHIYGTSRDSRINSAFKVDDPQALIGTLYENFGVPIDHYVNVDFCAFKGIVDAVGGVKVPFEYAVQDTNTGLNVPGPMCYKFEGDAALAYVRSRHFHYLDPATGQYREDPASDLGRISRQQDFMQRLIQRALDKGVVNPRAAKKIIDSTLEFVTRDDTLTVGKMLQFAQAMKSIQPGSIQTYQIEAYPTVIGGAQVLDPRIEGENMQAVLAVFQGRAQLATAPEQVFESTTTTSPVVVTTAPTTTIPVATTVDPFATTVPGAETTTTTAVATTSTTTTLPLSTATENVKGIVPPDDPTCR